MAVSHDLKCRDCGREYYDQFINPSSLEPCLDCNGPLEIRWDISQRRAPVTLNTTTHPSERTVVWQNHQTGSVAYPPANNVPMPERYAKNGYERVELDSLKKLDTFCKSKNVTNEKATFNNGNGV